MPGPKSTSRAKGRKAAPNTPSRKTRARLESRLASWPGLDAKDGSGRAMRCHKPGSQNRKK